jgi:hypothetical protein
MSVPGIAWVLGDTIASEIGDIGRFASPTKLAGSTGLCPRVYQSGGIDRRGPLAKNGPKYLRWALIEAAQHAPARPIAARSTCRTRRRLGRSRGAKVASIEGARGWRRRSGGCSPATSPLLRQAPRARLWPPDGPRKRCATGARPLFRERRPSALAA